MVEMLSLVAQLAGWALATVVLVTIYQGFNLVARWRYRHIPGPKPAWLLGNTLQLSRDHQLFVPAWYQACKAKYGRIFKWWLGLTPVVVVADADVARLVLVKHFKPFHDRYLLPTPMHPKRMAMFRTSILWAKGKEWATVRSAAQPLFHTAGLQQYAGTMDAAAGKLLARLQPHMRDGSAVDMYQLIGGQTLDVIAKSAFGVDFHAQEGGGKDASEHVLVNAARNMMANQSPMLQRLLVFVPPIFYRAVFAWLAWCPPPAMRRAEVFRQRMTAASLTLTHNALKRMGIPWSDPLGIEQALTTAEGSDVIKQLYKDSTPEPGSLIDHLVQARHKETGQPLETYRMVAQSQVFLLAGFETTQFVLTAAVVLLAQHLEVQRTLQQEVDAVQCDDLTLESLSRYPYTEAVINEVLRLYPSAPLTSRVALDDVDLNGMHIPRGTCVHVDIMSIQRDPAYWRQPDAFRPERFLPDSPEARDRPAHVYLPFGLGPRMCIGYKFALEEAAITLIRLAQAVTFELPKGADDPLDAQNLRHGISLGFKGPVNVHVRPRRQGQYV